MINPAARLDLLAFSQPPDGSEVLRYSYYSRKSVAAAPWVADIQFFSDQVGVGGATLRDTNMTKGSAIGNPRRFLAQFLNFNVYNIEIAEVLEPEQAGAIQLVLMQTVTKITVLDKEYLTVPTWTVPAGGGMTGVGGGSLAGPVFVNNGNPDKRNAYPIELNLEREASFSVNLLAPIAFTTAKNLVVEYVITGLLLRPRQ